MKAQIKLFKLFGIQIGLHYSWLLIAVLVVLSLAVSLRLPILSGAQPSFGVWRF